MFEHIIFTNLQMLETPKMSKFEKTRRKMMKIRVTNLSKHGHEINIYQNQEMAFL